MPDFDTIPSPYYDMDAAQHPDDSIVPSAGEVFGAAAGVSSLFGPTATLGRMQIRGAAQNQTPITGAQAESLYSFDGPTPETSIHYQPDDVVHPQVAQQQLDLMRQKVNDQWLISHTPSSFGANSAAVVGDIVGQAMDPLNVAATFIPGGLEIDAARGGLAAAGLTRAAAGAADLANLMKTSAAARITASGLNNAAGVALVQPILMAGAQQDHTDYTFATAAENVLFGGLLGAGLHGVGELGGTILRGMMRVGAKAMDDGVPIHPELAEDMANLSRSVVTEDLTDQMNPVPEPVPVGFQDPAIFKDALDTLNLQSDSRTPYVESEFPQTSDDALSKFGSNPQVGRVTEALEKLDKVGDIEGSPTPRQARQLTAITRGLNPFDLAESLSLAAQESERVREANNIPPEEKAKIISALREFGAQVSDLNEKIPSTRNARSIRQAVTPTDDQVSAEQVRRGDVILQKSKDGRYESVIREAAGIPPRVGGTDLDPVEANDKIAQAVRDGDYATAAQGQKQVASALENDPAVKLSDEDKEAVNAPIEHYKAVSKLIQDFAACVGGGDEL